MTSYLGSWKAARAFALLTVTGCFLPTQEPLAAGYLGQPSAPTSAPTATAVPASSVVSAPQKASSSAAKPRLNAAKWSELTDDQKSALEPLSKVWNSLPSNRQLKWLAVAADFKKLSAVDQAKLQSRMKDWVALEPKEREQARIGFATTQKISPEDKKVKWEAYQALSPQDKAALAAQGEKKVGAAAKPIAPLPADKKVKMPANASAATSPANTASNPSAAIHNKPKLANVTESVSPQTLLPNTQQ